MGRLVGVAAFVAIAAASSALAVAPPEDGFEVVDYDLALTPDLRTGAVAGVEIVTLRATSDDPRRVVFSGNALTIDQADLDGAPVETRHDGGALIIDLPRPVPRGRSAALSISYHGRPARGAARSETGLYTSYFACDWMVCRQDRFGEKAKFSLSLRVPAGMQTLSVGRMTSSRPALDGSVIQRWRAPRPYSAYLYGFAVGRFARAEETVGRVRLVFLSDATDSADLGKRFAPTADMVRFLSEKAGVALPVAQYTQLLVKGDEAQEAATYSVLGVDELPTDPGDPGQDWAIFHELTHQWWGNLVTCVSIRDFWLNEGVTTFMTAAWKEHRYGRAAYEAELDLARGRLDKARAKGFDMPLAWAGTYSTLGLRRAVQYSKGALFMDRLRTELGEKAFWAGLRRYTRQHAGGSVTSIDLERAMDAASGKDLKPLFEEWVFGSGGAGGATAAPTTR